MNRLATYVVSALALLVFAACSKETPAPAAAPAQDAATAAQPVATPKAIAAAEPAAASPAAEPTGEPTATAPTESISETADEVPAEAATAGVQPALKVGGPQSQPFSSGRFREGTNFQKIVPAQPTAVAPGRVEVVEVFWYGCGACFALDPAIESWRGKGKPDYVEFVRVPAMFSDATRMHARVFYTAELLGKLDALHPLIFREIHVNGTQLNTVEKISAFFRQHGVSADDFQKAFSSFAVESKLQRADFLNRRYRIQSVPTIVVNGKYLTQARDAGGEAELFALIGELAAYEHGG